MRYKINNNWYDVSYDVQNLLDYTYNIWLTNVESGLELPWDEVSDNDQEVIESLVDAAHSEPLVVNEE